MTHKNKKKALRRGDPDTGTVTTLAEKSILDAAHIRLIKERKTLQQLMRDFLVSYATGDSEQTAQQPSSLETRGAKDVYREENHELHEKLEAILNSGDAEIIGAVVPNLEVFFSRMRRPAARRKTGS
jgi:hypothetical protein